MYCRFNRLSIVLKAKLSIISWLTEILLKAEIASWTSRQMHQRCKFGGVGQVKYYTQDLQNFYQVRTPTHGVWQAPPSSSQWSSFRVGQYFNICILEHVYKYWNIKVKVKVDSQIFEHLNLKINKYKLYWTDDACNYVILWFRLQP